MSSVVTNMQSPQSRAGVGIGLGIFAIAAAIPLRRILSLRTRGKTPESKLVPLSVNFHFLRRCNYECRFCFHTDKTEPGTGVGPMGHVSVDEAKQALRLLANEGMKKVNFSGGEPFLAPKWLGEVARFCAEELKLESVSIVSNGSRITKEWLVEYGSYIDMIALSLDSTDPNTLEHIGRTEKGGAGKRYQTAVVTAAAQMIRDAGIELRINTTVTKASMDEDMNAIIAALRPKRWKVFQMLLVSGENWGKDQLNGRDATDLVITDEEFAQFVERHRHQPALIVEDNDTMRNSYLLLDERLRFLNCRGGDKRPTRPITEIGVQAALLDSGFDEESFHRRSAVYDWSRVKSAPSCGGGAADIEDIV